MSSRGSSIGSGPFSKSLGESIGGIGIVLQHAPAETGLTVWTYTEYKHLEEMPALEVGTRVRVAEPIAKVGRTGTQGGYYGPAGHAHLHVSAWYSETNEFRTGRLFVPKDGYWMDPLALFKAPLFASTALRDLPESEKQVAMPYVTTAGALVPPDTKVAWPLPCAPR